MTLSSLIIHRDRTANTIVQLFLPLQIWCDVLVVTVGLHDTGKKMEDSHELMTNRLTIRFVQTKIHLAERELASFIGAVTELFGPEQAGLCADDWLDESELMDSPPRSTSRDWRAVTVAASARLANR